MKDKIYCDVCDNNISNKSLHNKTKKHKLKSLSVVIRFYIKQIQLETIDYVINEYIIDYNKKFFNFHGYVENRNYYFCSNIDLGWIDLPFVVIGDEILKEYKCNTKELVDLKIIFVTDLEYQSYNHYLQQPRPKIERQVCKLIDRNSNLMKTLNKMPTPYSRYIIIKH